MKHIRTVVYRRTSETTEEEENVHRYIPRLVIILNVIMSPLIGIFMAARGNYDGKISLVLLSKADILFCFLRTCNIL